MGYGLFPALGCTYLNPARDHPRDCYFFPISTYLYEASLEAAETDENGWNNNNGQVVNYECANPSPYDEYYNWPGRGMGQSGTNQENYCMFMIHGPHVNGENYYCAENFCNSYYYECR